jgi:isocitrate dehydrogenase
MDNRKAPGRVLGELDNAGSHVYEAMYWAKELATQNDDQDLKGKFVSIAKELEANIEKILEEIKATKGKPIDIGGYYHACSDMVKASMRPSATFNKILATLN